MLLGCDWCSYMNYFLSFSSLHSLSHNTGRRTVTANPKTNSLYHEGDITMITATNQSKGK